MVVVVLPPGATPMSAARALMLSRLIPEGRPAAGAALLLPPAARGSLLLPPLLAAAEAARCCCSWISCCCCCCWNRMLARRLEPWAGAREEDPTTAEFEFRPEEEPCVACGCV